jgi:acyl-CoA thioesterase
MTPELLEEIRRGFAADQFAAANGVELVELGEGYAKARLELTARHLNSVGIVHGGAITTLADFTFAVACNSAGRLAVAVNINLSCLKATRSGTLVAEAREVSRSRRISTCTVRVCDDEGQLVALFQGTAFIKDGPYPPEAPPAPGQSSA